MLYSRIYVRSLRSVPRSIICARRYASITPKGPGAIAAEQANATAARDSRIKATKLANEGGLKGAKKDSATNKLEQTLARFWEKVTCEEAADGFKIQLDGKTIKTPLGLELLIPKEKQSLAFLITNEWKSLPNLQVKPYLLPLTSLASRAIDLAKAADDLEAQAQIGSIDGIKDLLMKYLDTDTLLVFAPRKDCDGELRKEQEKLYFPMKKSMEEYFSKFSEDGKPIVLQHLDTETSGIIGNKQSERTKEVVRRFLDSLDSWQLVALERATLTCKSLLCGVAIVRMNNEDDKFAYTLEDLARAATLETILQTARWGEVEDTHDVEKVDVRRHLASASILCYNKPAE
ncbi:DEKNAAC104185 [Brettanomyces naardenensis]|uniref:DEKNAAC104185 n=1 Tax=Brettanomyces naardenensis TaxID=13370 RepID=A0A448YQ72_BRENA|nr:DEKNAAC104185 [Brettanomyces naardenensis]